VCRAGRELASENRLQERITYLAADFLRDDLPGGFDMALLCDVGLFGESLFRRIHAALNAGGQVVIVDKFAPSRTQPPASRVASAFLDSLLHPGESIHFATAELVRTRLLRAGFRDVALASVPLRDELPWNLDWSVLTARKQTNGI
jgi:hypothetical protein